MSGLDAAMTVFADGARIAADEAGQAARELEAEGERIIAALAKADTLAAFIINRAMSVKVEADDAVTIEFDSIDAASIANMALAYQQARAGETVALTPAET